MPPVTRLHLIETTSLEFVPLAPSSSNGSTPTRRPLPLQRSLAIETGLGVIVVEPGSGLLDLIAPFRRLRLPGWWLVQRRKPKRTFRQALEEAQLDADRVTDLVLSHVNADRLGALSDFPLAAVHALPSPAVEALFANPDQAKPQVAHAPRYLRPSSPSSSWHGFSTHRLAIEGAELHLVELPGHAPGHAGILLRCGDFEVLHCGSAVGSLAELTAPRPPTSADQWLRLWSDNAPFERLATRDRLRALVRRDHRSLTVVAAHGDAPRLSLGQGPHPDFG